MINKLRKGIFGLVLVGGIVLLASAGWSDPLVDIFFDPSSGNFNQGATFEVKIMISSEAAVNNIAAIDAAVFYDTRYLVYQGYVDKLTNNWSAAEIRNEVKGYNGTFYFSKYSDASIDYDINLSPSSPYHLYSLIFKVVSPAGLTATLNFDSDPNDAGGDDLNIVDRYSQSDLVRNIGSAAYSIQANELPTSFNLITPSNGATGVALYPYLSWEASTDRDGGPITYTLIMTREGSSWSYTQSGISQNEYTHLSALRTNDTYYWKVIAYDNENTSTECNSPFSFMTMGTPKIITVTWEAGTDSGFVNGTLIITGESFGGDPGEGNRDTSTNNVKIEVSDGSLKVVPDEPEPYDGIEVYSWTDTEIKVGVPLSLEGTYLVAQKDKYVKVTASSQTSNTGYFNLKPRLWGIDPSSGKEGDAVTLTGNAFGDNISDIDLWFGEEEATVTSANHTILTATVPSGLDIGIVLVTAEVNDQKSNPVNFNVENIPVTLNLTVLLQGYYNSSDDTQKLATVEVQFRSDPDTASAAVATLELSTGQASGTDPGEASTTLYLPGNRYHLVVQQLMRDGDGNLLYANHLGVITEKITFEAGKETPVDLSDSAGLGMIDLYGDEDNLYVSEEDGKRVLWTGDANGDGEVNAIDATFYTNDHLDQRINPTADFDGSGDVDIWDGDWLINAYDQRSNIDRFNIPQK